MFETSEICSDKWDEKVEEMDNENDINVCHFGMSKLTWQSTWLPV